MDPPYGPPLWPWPRSLTPSAFRPPPAAAAAAAAVLFAHPARSQKIYEKIQQGVFDVSNESFGIKVGMAAAAPGGLNAGQGSAPAKSSGCC